jgi:hypothetical protein
MPSDRWTGALPEYDTIGFPKGETLAEGTKTDAWLVCLRILLRSARVPRLACNHGLRHRRLELLITQPANSGTNSSNGRVTLSRKWL